MAALAPMLAGGAATAGGVAATTAATKLAAGSAIAGGLADYGAAQGSRQAALINAYIARTRAMQTDVSARQGLNDELATIRTTFAANGQRPNVGTEAITDELRGVRARERRIEFGNQMQAAADYKTQAANAGRQGAIALASGLVKADPRLFDLSELRRGNGLSTLTGGPSIFDAYRLAMRR